MISKYINLKDKHDLNKLIRPAEVLNSGGLVLMPTETVYGIGANALDENAVKRIFEVKGRKSDNPLIVHISNIGMLKDFVEDVNKIEQKLINEFWPGPLTIVFKKKKVIPDVVTANLNTVAIRMPSNIIARMLIEYSNVPVAAPSANVSGKPSGTNVKDVLKEFDGKVDYIIDGGDSDIGLESTVVKVIDNKVHILRPGKITAEEISGLVGEVVINKHILHEVKSTEKIESPGVKYKHYAPDTSCMMVYSEDNDKMVKRINELSENKSVIILCRKQNFDKYIAKYKLSMGETQEEIAKNMYTILRKIDTYDVDMAIIEGTTKKGIGLAINNRLIRACEYNYIEV